MNGFYETNHDDRLLFIAKFRFDYYKLFKTGLPVCSFNFM